MSDTPDMSENGNTQNLFDFDRSKGNFSFPERHKFDAGYEFLKEAETAEKA